MKKGIGFIGIGEMGYPMARNLIKAGYRLSAYDNIKERLLEIEKHGAEIFVSPEKVAQASDIIICMVRTTDQVVSVIRGEGGVLEGARPDTIVLIMSTVEPKVVRELSEVANAKGIKLLDAPVSGAKQGAEAGTLTIMVGGPKDVFEECRPIFEVLGKNIFYLGNIGMGEAAKLVNNLLLMINMNAAFEAMNLAQAAGVKIDVLLELLKVSTGNSWVIEHWGVVKSWKENYMPDGTLDTLYKKDIPIVLDLAKDLRTPLHLAALSTQLGWY